MATTTCPECGQVSGADACPNCGYPASAMRRRKQSRRILLITSGTAMLGLSIAYVIGAAAQISVLATSFANPFRLDPATHTFWDGVRNVIAPNMTIWVLVGLIGLAYITLGATLRTRPVAQGITLAGAITATACLILTYAAALAYGWLLFTLTDGYSVAGMAASVFVLGVVAGIVLLFVGALRRAPRLLPIHS